MKLALLLAAALAPFCAAAGADGTVRFNNYDSNNPIFYCGCIRFPTGSFVEILGGPPGGSLFVLSNSVGQTVFTLNEPGFFDAGLGVVPGIPEGSAASFQVRVWHDPFIKARSTVFTQETGTQLQPAALQMPSFVLCIGPGDTSVCVPEPSPLWLGLLGATGLLFRRRH